MMFFDHMPQTIQLHAMNEEKRFEIATGFPKLERVFDQSDLDRLHLVLGKRESKATKNNGDDAAIIDVKTL